MTDLFKVAPGRWISLAHVASVQCLDDGRVQIETTGGATEVFSGDEAKAVLAGAGCKVDPPPVVPGDVSGDVPCDVPGMTPYTPPGQTVPMQ